MSARTLDILLSAFRLSWPNLNVRVSREKKLTRFDFSGDKGTFRMFRVSAGSGVALLYVPSLGLKHVIIFSF